MRQSAALVELCCSSSHDAAPMQMTSAVTKPPIAARLLTATSHDRNDRGVKFERPADDVQGIPEGVW